MDDFYRPASCPDCLPQGLVADIYHSLSISPAILATLLFGPILIFLTARLLLIGDTPDPKEEKEQTSWMVPFQPVPWRVLECFFGVPRRSEEKYKEISEELKACNRFILDEPHMTLLLNNATQNLERNIPQMISFINTSIDLQPWEQHAQAHFISSSEAELNLQSLIRDMTGYALVPAVFGHALLEKYPAILHDLHIMDTGSSYLLKNLPPWIPWPGVVQAHMARFKALQCLDEHQKAVDGMIMGMGTDASWGDLEDVSELIMKRNIVFREHGLELKERADITILYSLSTLPSLIIFWHILYILNTPNLLSRIRTELNPYAKITKPFSIGAISEAPKLVLASQGLAENCPLLRSTYLETIRIVDQGVVMSSSLGGIEGSKEEIKFPETFDPERFRKAPVASSSSAGNTKYASIHKSQLFIERGCLAVVAAILAFWDFEPIEKGSGWKIPDKQWMRGIALPANDLRIRVRRRKFDWAD
ncbi:hypothetical protein ONS95_013013 [Cadophora gregata]|uniref:uncharacterized protein n=1 Tax=Cadophora gregata TaxID=51156 RepID=UPI0026DC042F|nr:uncharacterized protein ONS95_013013 [Cadophora gregata]KAK0100997.1 hypothetical protein ONS96_006229 [Cadophora gregata f. sp. sojae]KAK0115972.1 hypothetical protein ONS95_013013 [Cadophora gregata]